MCVCVCVVYFIINKNSGSGGGMGGREREKERDGGKELQHALVQRIAYSMSAHVQGQMSSMFKGSFSLS